MPFLSVRCVFFVTHSIVCYFEFRFYFLTLYHWMLEYVSWNLIWLMVFCHFSLFFTPRANCKLNSSSHPYRGHVGVAIISWWLFCTILCFFTLVANVLSATIRVFVVCANKRNKIDEPAKYLKQFSNAVMLLSLVNKPVTKKKWSSNRN